MGKNRKKFGIKLGPKIIPMNTLKCEQLVRSGDESLPPFRLVNILIIVPFKIRMSPFYSC